MAQEPKILGLHLLPGYSPELNPDEQVWNQLKAKLGKAALKTKDEFISFVRSDLSPHQLACTRNIFQLLGQFKQSKLVFNGGMVILIHRGLPLVLLLVGTYNINR